MSKVTKLKTSIKAIDKQDNDRLIKIDKSVPIDGKILVKGNKTNVKNDTKVVNRKVNQSLSSSFSSAKSSAIASKQPATQLTKQTLLINLNKVGQSNSSLIKKSMNLTHTKSNDLLKPKFKATIIKSSANLPIKPTKTVNTSLIMKINDTKKSMPVKNVMNTIQNVTVSSPPLKRKEITDIIPRERTRTRTLAPDEVLVLKNIRDVKDQTPVNPLIVQNHWDEITPDSFDESGRYDIDAEVSMVSIREPIAFDICLNEEYTNNIFDAPVSAETLEKSSTNSDYDYDDDFESYESDFESGTSSASGSSLESDEQSPKSSKSPTLNNLEIDDRSSSTQEQNNFKNTDERKLDSGNYELRAQRIRLQMNSIEEIELNLSEDQNDSGLGYNNYNTLKHKNHTTAKNEETGYNKFSHNKNTLKLVSKTKRDNDLMKKLTLDTMTFILFDMKPISYDIYMKLYGKQNTVQSTTQTNNNNVNEETQTDSKTYNTMWTQHPAVFTKYGFNDMKKLYHEERIGCGCDINVEQMENGLTTIEKHDSSDITGRNKWFHIINKKSHVNITNDNSASNCYYTLINSQANNTERLNKFIKKSSLTIIYLLNKKLNINKLNYTPIKMSSGYFSLNKTKENNIINKLYTNVNLKNIFITLVAKNSYENLLYLWNLLDISKPIHVLHCWNIINCIEINYYFNDIVLAGLNDGSIAMWDLREPMHYYNNQSDIDQEEIIRIPSQVITPDVTINYGACVSLKTLTINKQNINNKLFNKLYENNDKIIEIYALFETGIIVVWSLIETLLLPMNGYNLIEISSNNKNNLKYIKHNSYNSRINLLQNHIININELLETRFVKKKSKFEKKFSYFNSNLFDDNILKELQQNDENNLKTNYNNELNIKFIDFIINNEQIFIATNCNFLYYFYKNVIKKILIDDSNFANITSITELPNDDSIALGLSDGCVKILKFSNQNILLNTDNYVTTNKSTTRNHFIKSETINVKSCVIENIIKDERKIDIENLNNYHKIIGLDLTQNINNSRNNEEILLNLINEQILINRNYFYKNFTINRIELNKKKEFFYYLINKQLIIYNYKLNIIYNYEKLLNNVKYFNFVYDNYDVEFLVILTTENEVQIHKMVEHEI